MTKVISLEPRTMSRYDKQHVVGYINEQKTGNYHPEQEPGTGTAEDDGEGITVYQYDEVIIESADMSRDNLVNGLIRKDYSATQEFAILRHHSLDAEKYADEWEAYNAAVEKAKTEVARWLEQ